MAHDIFITYSVNDRPYAESICDGLEAAGIRCWIAPRDITPGLVWAEAVMDAIEGSRVMLLVFSQHANASQQVIREVERAVNRAIPVIPVRLENTSPSRAMEYFLSSPHWLDAIPPPIERHMERIVAVARSLLGRPAVPLPVFAPPQAISKSRRRSLLAPVRLRAAPVTLGILLFGLGTLSAFLMVNKGELQTIGPTPAAETTGLSQPPTAGRDSGVARPIAAPARAAAALSTQSMTASPPRVDPPPKRAPPIRRNERDQPTGVVTNPVTSEACTAGDAGGCYELAIAHYFGRGIPVNYDRARQLYEQACDAGSAAACNNLGVMYGTGVGVDRDAARAITLYDGACTKGYQRGCANLADMHLGGIGTRVNFERAQRLYVQACDAGDPYACNNLGVMYGNGRGVAIDYRRALQLYDRACRANFARGCTNLGDMYFGGLGVPVDNGRARQLFDVACASGDDPACSKLGAMYGNGVGVVQDYGRAYQLYDRACRGKVARACSNIAVLYEQGLGVARDSVEAVRLYRIACSDGVALACERLRQ